MKFHEGDEVITLTDPPHGQGWIKGRKYIIDYPLDPDPESDDDRQAYDLKLEYWGSAGWAYEDELELSRPLKEMVSRRLPSPEDIIKAMGPSSWEDFETGLRVDETDIGGETRAIEFYGRTEEGLRFGARMEVTRIWETDF